MKTIKGLAAILTLTGLTFILMGWHPIESKTDIDLKEHVVVLLKFKTQPEMLTNALSEFNNLLEKVKKEPNFISIKLHVDPNDPTNILLYEEWEDQAYYNNEHMNTSHIKKFMVNSTNFLTGPPEISFWEVKTIYK